MADYRTGVSVLDAALNQIVNNCERQVAVSADPGNYAGVAAVTLADVAMAPADFTLADGTVSGRKVQIARKSVTPSADGTATHICLVDDTNTEILLMVPIPATGLLTTVDTDFAPWEHEIRESEGA